MQIAAWEAAIIGAIISAVLGLVALALGLVRQHREDRRQRARMGYELVDALFDDDGASELLMAIDSTAPPGRHRKQSDDRLSADFVAILSGSEVLPSGRAQIVYGRLDSFFYYLDRFEHAINAGLTDFTTVRMPVGYYIRLMTPFKARIVSYVNEVDEPRVLAFLERYPVWRGAKPLS